MSNDNLGGHGRTVAADRTVRRRTRDGGSARGTSSLAPLLAIGGVCGLAWAAGYALSGRGRLWGRLVCGTLAMTAIPLWAMTVTGFGGPGLAVATPRGLWVARYYWSFLAVLGLACAIPHRAVTDAGSQAGVTGCPRNGAGRGGPSHGSALRHGTGCEPVRNGLVTPPNDTEGRTSWCEGDRWPASSPGPGWPGCCGASRPCSRSPWGHRRERRCSTS